LGWASSGRRRRAERAFWRSYGLAPAQRFVDAGSPAVRLRVQEVGSGEPVLFVNGTGGPGAYFAPLLAELRGFRCLVLDRPGWGLSDPVDYSRAAYRTVVAELLRDAWTRSASTGRAWWAARSGTCGGCGWPRPTPRGWNAWSCWAAGR
jgi:pimeloyl-ACP methyl ester carboxylesterase